jgi:uncharacterized membrane protein YedE/YeeE
MTIDWNAFTPWRSLAGGMLIGLAAALLMWGNGRIAGVSGIVGGLWQRAGRADAGWRIAFIAGLIAAPLVYLLAAPLPVPRIDAPAALLAASGLLVGLGTRYAGGCTSGHGVCGLSRLSPPSALATLAFMGAGIASVFVMRHLLP